jgi:hypothetical protein
MKKLLFALAILAFSSQMSAQSRAIRDFMNNSPRQQDAIRLNIGSLALSIGRGFVDEPEARDWLRKIYHATVLLYDNNNPVNPSEVSKLMAGLQREKFEELGYFRDEDEDMVRILIKEDGDFITDLVLLVEGPENFIMINLEGRLRYSELNDISLSFEGSNKLKKLPEDRKQVKKS